MINKVMRANGYPKISIITPSYNQAEFLERTILSVIEQNYPNLEYIIIDGGSTDGSCNIIEQYSDHIAFWESKKDNGQAHAINKGLKISTGEWVGWQNSDDIYYPGVFHHLADTIVSNRRKDLIIGNINMIDRFDNVIRDIKYVRPCYRGLLSEGMVLANQSAFWRRDIHNKLGWINEGYTCSFDYEWFLRVTQRCRALHVNSTWGGFRIHENAKTSNITRHFTDENQYILSGRNLPYGIISLYKLRRILLLLLKGNVYYVIRGISRRLSGKDKGLTE